MIATIKRTVVASLICSTLLFSSCSKTDTEILQEELVSNLSQEAETEFYDVCYFASWKQFNKYYVSITAYIKTNVFSSEEEQYSKYKKFDYVVSKEDFEELQNKTGSFEAIIPFNKETLNKLIYITQNYEPKSINNAHFNDIGKEIINEISK